MTTVKRARPIDRPIAAACSLLMGLALLALLCLARPDLPNLPGADAGASFRLEQRGEVAALLRFAGKPQAIEVRSTRSLPAKPASGDPAIIPPAGLLAGRHFAPPLAEAAGGESVPASRAGAHRPRAPPLA